MVCEANTFILLMRSNSVYHAIWCIKYILNLLFSIGAMRCWWIFAPGGWLILLESFAGSNIQYIVTIKKKFWGKGLVYRSTEITNDISIKEQTCNLSGDIGHKWSGYNEYYTLSLYTLIFCNTILCNKHVIYSIADAWRCKLLRE